jgi:branched-chain amino acid transport system substrate-binding protein
MKFATGMAVAAIGAMTATSALAEDIKIGVFMGFTGPIESTVADMAPGAELAISEVNEAGGLLGGMMVMPVRGDRGLFVRLIPIIT